MIPTAFQAATDKENIARMISSARGQLRHYEEEEKISKTIYIRASCDNKHKKLEKSNQLHKGHLEEEQVP